VASRFTVFIQKVGSVADCLISLIIGAVDIQNSLEQKIGRSSMSAWMENIEIDICRYVVSKEPATGQRACENLGRDSTGVRGVHSSVT